MAKLAYRTKNSASAQGKPKVYFAAHPMDFETYFEKTVEEILKTQNCAIWYDEEPEAPYDASELESDLRDMQLVVIPITSRFLYEDCRAREVEFAYACEHHIPVLPLMQERELESAFNAICGDLQFMDRNNCDITTDSYEEKLEKFLSSVLVDDDTAARVRAAFDAYVFLSYRKKDRKYAKDLMRLIHSNELCRDIAIWYDEYLTPGENFNDAIREAMEKSSFFALMVTPNLVNEVNYVMTVEYPAAREAGKPVIPVEMQETDADALKEKYDGIPDSIKPKEQERLQNAIIDALKNIAIRENDTDPQHLFFIGLAYLSGIDVEVDHERARALLEASAEKDFLPAMVRLASMFRRGEGVAQDFGEAALWLERIVTVKMERYLATGTKEDALEYLQALFSQGYNLSDMRRFSEAAAIYKDIEIVAREMIKESGETEIYEYLAESLSRQGSISRQEHRYEEARQYYVDSMEIRRKIFDETNSGRVLQGLISCCGSLGGVCAWLEDFAGARKYYEESLELIKRLRRKKGEKAVRSDLSSAYEQLGDLCRREKDYEKAKEYYAQCFPLAKQEFEENKTVDTASYLTMVLERFGALYQLTGENETARTCYEDALNLDQVIIEAAPANISVLRHLSVVHERLGLLDEEEGTLDAAWQHFQEALKIREQIFARTKTIQHYIDMATTYDRLANICRTRGDFAQAMNYYKQALDIRQQWSDAAGTADAAHDVAAGSFCNLGDTCMEAGELEQARGYYNTAIELLKTLCEKEETPKIHHALWLSYRKLYRIYSQENDYENAKKYAFLAMGRAKILRDADDTELNRERQAISLEEMGDAYRQLREISLAKVHYELCCQLRQDIFEGSRTIPNLRNLFASIVHLGEICVFERNLDEAKKHYLTALEIAATIFNEQKTASAYDDVATIYYKIGVLDEHGEEGRAALRKAVEMWKYLEELAPGNPETQWKIRQTEEILNG